MTETDGSPWKLTFTPSGSKVEEDLGWWPSKESAISLVQVEATSPIHWTPLLKGSLAMAANGEYMIIKHPI